MLVGAAWSIFLGGHAGWQGMVMPVGAACPARIGHASILYDPTF